MRRINFSQKSQKDIVRMAKRGKERSKLESVLMALSQKGMVDKKHQPHMLKGNYQGYWECHIEHDWLLIYQITDTSIGVHRIDSHADLFNI